MSRPGSPLGLHRVLGTARVLPQAAWRLDDRPQLWADEVRVDVERLNLDAAAFRALRTHHGRDPAALRGAASGIVADRGKMHNPVTGSGGMLIGRVAEVGPRSPLGLRAGDRVATLVSLSVTPLRVTDGLSRWDGGSEQVPARGHAILFGRSLAHPVPDDLPGPLALAVLDVAGAPALMARLVGIGDAVAVLGAAGKSGLLCLAAARRAGAQRVVGVVPDEPERAALEAAGLADEIVLADARDPVGVLDALTAAGGPVHVTAVCVDAPGAEHAAVLATRTGGTVVFYSMTTSFTAAALGAESVVADVRLLIGNGYVPGHAAAALDLIRADTRLRAAFERRLEATRVAA